MCCESNGYTREQIDGECPECGEPTVDGDAFESCGYSPLQCKTCNSRPCDGSC